MTLKYPWFLRTVLELVFVIIIQATSYFVFHVSCQSHNRRQLKSMSVWIEVSLPFMFAFEFRSVTSDKKWWMWHCHVRRSLNVTLCPGSQMAGRKSMRQTQCGACRVAMDLGHHRARQAVSNQSIISFKGRVKWDLMEILCGNLQRWTPSLQVCWFTHNRLVTSGWDNRQGKWHTHLINFSEYLLDFWCSLCTVRLKRSSLS